MDRAAVLEAIDHWTVEERLRLIEEIWDGLSEAHEAIPLGDAQEADLRRRLEAYRDHPESGTPWEDVEARLRGRRR